jgi:hypothetical protein
MEHFAIRVMPDRGGVKRPAREHSERLMTCLVLIFDATGTC